MKTTLFFLLFSAIFSNFYAQEYVFGKILSEDGFELGDVTIMNMRTEEKTTSDKDGVFMMKGAAKDEIRFIKPKYERYSVVISENNFNGSLRVVLKQTPELIEEVKIGFVATGNLKKDVKALEPSRKVRELNENMTAYMKTKPTETYPTLKTPSTLSSGPNYSAGQVNLLGLIGFLVKKVQKKPTKANYSEQQAFYRRVKESINMGYFTKCGLDEYEFDALLVYADNRYDLSKNFRNNFNITTIENYLKISLKDFMSTRMKGLKTDSTKS